MNTSKYRNLIGKKMAALSRQILHDSQKKKKYLSQKTIEFLILQLIIRLSTPFLVAKILHSLLSRRPLYATYFPYFGEITK